MFIENLIFGYSRAQPSEYIPHALSESADTRQFRSLPGSIVCRNSLEANPVETDERLELGRQCRRAGGDAEQEIRPPVIVEVYAEVVQVSAESTGGR
jgi:hypothetical protein